MDDKKVIVNQELLFQVLAAASEKHAELGYAIDQLYKMAGEKTDKGRVVVEAQLGWPINPTQTVSLVMIEVQK